MDDASKARRTTRKRSVTKDGAPQLKQERAVQTRALILRAAAAAFAESGFPNVTVLDIAERAGMTKGAVYFHFTNKETLAVAVTEEFYRWLPQVLEPALEEGREPREAVVDLMRRTAVSFRDDVITQAGARLQIERPYIGAPLPAPYERFTELLTDLLRRCEQAGELPGTMNPEGLARVLRSALFGAQHISWVTDDRADVVDRVEEIIEALLLPVAGTVQSRTL